MRSRPITITLTGVKTPCCANVELPEDEEKMMIAEVGKYAKKKLIKRVRRNMRKNKRIENKSLMPSL